MRSRFGRRVRETFTRDWLEIVVTSVGVLFLGFAVVFLIALITLIARYNDPNSGLPIGQGLYKTSKGTGLAVFSVGAVVFAMVGWTFAGSSIRRRARVLFRRRGQGQR
jgi:hypothetical protein